MDDKIGDFIIACLSHLEGETDEVPTLDGMIPEERRRARRWLEHLAETRDAVDLMGVFTELERDRKAFAHRRSEN